MKIYEKLHLFRNILNQNNIPNRLTRKLVPVQYIVNHQQIIQEYFQDQKHQMLKDTMNLQNNHQVKNILLLQNQVVESTLLLQDQTAKVTLLPQDQAAKVILLHQDQVVEVTLLLQDQVQAQADHLRAVHLRADHQAVRQVARHEEEEDNIMKLEIRNL